MSVEDENKAVVERFWGEMFNGKNLEVADELFTYDYVHHIPSLTSDEAGSDAIRTLLTIIFRICPNIEATVEGWVAEGEKVVTSWTARGNPADEMRDVDSDDDEVKVSGVNIYSVSGDQIREDWWHLDARVFDESQTSIREEYREYLLKDIARDAESVALFGGICHIMRGCYRC